uniref:Uncharacterized protein n=1 Tax=Anguilla anguilla TaxID=7936 RepID=A0A0E9PF45_ANGAN
MSSLLIFQSLLGCLFMKQ